MKNTHPTLLPLFPLRSVLLPQATLELKFFEPRYMALLEECLKGETLFGVVFCTDQQDETGTLSRIGTSARIIDDMPMNDGSRKVTLVGETRFEVGPLDVHPKGYYVTTPHWLEDDNDVEAQDPMMKTAGELAHIYEDLLASIDPDMVRINLENDLGPQDLFRILQAMILPDEKRQRVLEVASRKQRAHMTVDYLRTEIQTLRFLLAEPDAFHTALN